MTGVDTLSEWFTDGLTGQGLAICNGAKPDYMLVVCDTFSNEDYPVYVTADEFWEEHDRLDDKNMQRIVEVYDLRMNMNQQMAEFRAWHPPARGSLDLEAALAAAPTAGERIGNCITVGGIHGEPHTYRPNSCVQWRPVDFPEIQMHSSTTLIGRDEDSGKIADVPIDAIANIVERFIRDELDVALNVGERQTLREYLVFGGPQEIDPNERVR